MEPNQLHRLQDAFGQLRDAAGASDFGRVRALLHTIEKTISDGLPVDWTTLDLIPAIPISRRDESPCDVSMLERAIEIAAAAHARQTDKAGLPYVLHPLRVMVAQRSDAARIVGVLHDVCEDTEWRLEGLRAKGFSEEILRGIDAVTRREGEAYPDFVSRAAGDPLGRPVKVADLEDNSNLERIPVPTEADLVRRARYASALSLLKDQGKE